MEAILVFLLAAGCIFGIPIYILLLLQNLRDSQTRGFASLKRELADLKHELLARTPSGDPTTTLSTASKTEPITPSETRASESADLIPASDSPPAIPTPPPLSPVDHPRQIPANPSAEKFRWVSPHTAVSSSVNREPADTIHSVVESLSKGRSDRPDPSPVATSTEPTALRRFESAAVDTLKKIWSWIIVGEEHIPSGVSIEYAIASQWLLRLGILILVIGVGFFLKYSFDHNLITPVARVAMASSAGLGLLIAGTRLLGGRYHLFGQGLMGGGLAMLYFSVYAAANFFKLIDPTTAFVLMGIVTVLAGGISVRFNSMLVAVLGIIGGYGTPLMLSAGSPNFIALYGYMLILGIGALGVCYWKNWPFVNLLSFLCTYALYFAAMSSYRVDDFWSVIPFLTAFFVLFSTMTFLYKVVNGAHSNLLDVAALLINSFVFYGQSYRLVSGAYGKEWAAVFTLGLALFYTLHVYHFLLRKLVDRELLISFLGLASFFVIVTVPLVLSAEWITLTWSVQALVLLWIARQLGSRTLKYVSFVLYGIVMFRFGLMDLPGQFNVLMPADVTWRTYWPKLVERLVMFGVPVLSMGVASRLLQSWPAEETSVVHKENDVPEVIPASWAPHAIIGLGLGLLFLYLNLELSRTIGFAWSPLRLPVLTILWLAACGLVFRESIVRNSRTLLVTSLFGLLAVLLKLFTVDIPAWELSPQMVYGGDYSFVHASLRLLDFGVIIAFFTFAYAVVAGKARDKDAAAIFAVCGMGVLFTFMTLELNTALLAFLPAARAGGISILWSIFAFAWLLHGIWKNRRPLRYCGLALFGIVIAKVFFDLRTADPFYRIIAFIALGIIVLAGSFIYLKYRETFAVKLANSEQEST